MKYSPAAHPTNWSSDSWRLASVSSTEVAAKELDQGGREGDWSDEMRVADEVVREVAAFRMSTLTETELSEVEQRKRRQDSILVEVEWE